MILSRNWLADYVHLDAPTEEVVERLLMAGLNHESTSTHGGDEAIEIEVTSNRPDWLGHIGVARELAVLFGSGLAIPDPQPREEDPSASSSVSISLTASDMCPYYCGRVIRGVKIGPSPQWLIDKLATVGVTSVNNVVDITNYVMLECGQPLHAFDLDKVHDSHIIVRRAKKDEEFLAINHKTYSLTEEMCVIADTERPIALAGVMGGADSEISDSTTDVFLESAQFAPLAVRAAARGLVLASGSSYRFERGPDPAAVEWASLRAAALILEIAGGTLSSGIVEAGTLACSPASIDFRHHRVEQVLGIDVPLARQKKILQDLGFISEESHAEVSRWLAPTWRRDAYREIDLIEEVARIEGYDKVPEDQAISARPVELSCTERATRAVAEVLVAAGFCEAMTRSVVTEAFEVVESPWTALPPFVCRPALIRGADRLRRTLLPSLLDARLASLSVGAPHAELFEIAHAYLPFPSENNEAPRSQSPAEEPLLASLATEGDYFRAKGLAEEIFKKLRIGVVDQENGQRSSIEYRPIQTELLECGRAAEVVLHRAEDLPVRVGVLGEVSEKSLKMFSQSGPVSVVELRIDLLDFAISEERKIVRPSDFPAVERDINLVVSDEISWADISAAIHAAAEGLLEQCRLVQVWHDVERLGEGKKSVVVALRLRSSEGTLSGEEASRIMTSILDECAKRVGAVLR